MTAFRAGVLAGIAASALACGSPAQVAEDRAMAPAPSYTGQIAASDSVDSVDSVEAQVHSWATSRDVAETEPAVSLISPAPRARVASGRARVVDRGPIESQRVALTFDAGADRGYAEQILDTLRSQGVLASFGMTGHWAEANPDLLRRIVGEGHHLINHTQTHDSFTGFSTGRGPKSFEARVRELELTEAAVRRIAEATTRPYFRPPYGDLDASVVDDVQSQGYEIVAMWTVDSLGWNGLSRTEIEARCLRLAAPGAIYIFHVGSNAQDGPALPAVIEGLRRAGYQMGTLDWLLFPRGPQEKSR